MNPEIRIRGYHTDMYQHVNNARYLEFLEEGRWQLLEDHMNLEEMMNNNFLFFVVNINISFKSPAKANDIIIVKSGLGKIGNTSVVFKQKIINKQTGAVYIESDCTFVIADGDGNPRKLEGELKENFLNIPALEK
ncbi:MAG: acyl-CoA thioesterase [Desulfobacteraceae bacterium]|nr:acyl-CoA thioesterase [Desulfobacteraceae bacterium]